MSPPVVAGLLHIDADRVVKLIRSGELTAINIASRDSQRPRFRVSPEALQDFLRSRQVVPPLQKPRRRRNKTGIDEIETQAVRMLKSSDDSADTADDDKANATTWLTLEPALKRFFDYHSALFTDVRDPDSLITWAAVHANRWRVFRMVLRAIGGVIERGVANKLEPGRYDVG